jgi:MFS family permease
MTDGQIFIGWAAGTVIGLIIAGVVSQRSEDDDEAPFFIGLAAFFWPMALALAAAVTVIAAPVLLGRWLSKSNNKKEAGNVHDRQI